MCAKKHPAATLLTTIGIRWPAPTTARRGWGGGGLGWGATGSARAAQEPGDAGVGEGVEFHLGPLFIVGPANHAN